MMSNIIKKIFITGISSLLLLVIINIYINNYSKEYIFKNPQKLKKSYTVLVLGAYVYRDGTLSAVLKDRALKALELYKNKTVSKILLSGDHGKKNYDEVNHMKNFLLKRGVPASDIFMDHAGFNTYNSIVRAKKIFLTKNLIIVTQKFHLPRAIYIARKKGLNAYGYIADRRIYLNNSYNKFREFFANIKAFIHVGINKSPKFLGPKIPITGDSKKSWD